MTIVRPVTTTALVDPRSLQALRRWAAARVFAFRRNRRTRRRSTFTPSVVPQPVAIWQIDRHELRSALDDSHW
jgi:hypothetical protein